MRGLSSNLQVAQAAASRVPYVHLQVGAQDLSARVLSVVQNEKPFEGSTKITLSNNDQGLTAIDQRGMQVRVGWGFRIGTSSFEWSDGPPVWVDSYTDHGEAGEAVRELTCIDLWGRLGLDHLASGGLDLTGALTGQLGPGVTVIGQSSGTRAKVIYSGLGFISVNQVAGPGFTNGERVSNTIFPANFIQLTGISTWGGGPGPGWNGNMTIINILQGLVSYLVPLVWDSDDGVINSMRPVLSVENGASLLGVFKDLLGRTKSYARIGADGSLHVGSVATNPGVTVVYDSINTTYINLLSKKLQNPTTVAVFNSKAAQTGVATTAAVVSDPIQLQQITKIVDVEIQSVAEGTQIGQSILRRAQMDSVVGRFLAKMNVGQELWDYVSVTDYRTGSTYLGWVGEITRVYQHQDSVYTIEVGLGGLFEGGEGTGSEPGDVNYPNPNSPGDGGFAPSVGQLYLDSVLDGPTNYRRVAFNDVDGNGHVRLATVIQDTDHRTVTDTQIAAIEAARSFLILKNQFFGLSFATVPGSTGVSWSTFGLQAYNGGVNQFYIQSSNGVAYAGGGLVYLDQSGVSIRGQTLLFYTTAFQGPWRIFAPDSYQDGPGGPIISPVRMPHTNATPLYTEAAGGWWASQGLFVNTGQFLGPAGSGTGDATLWFVTRNSSQQVINVNYMPFDDNRARLGSSSHRWSEVWAVTVNGRDLVVAPDIHAITFSADSMDPRNGPNSGTIGHSGIKWSQIHALDIYPNRIAMDSGGIIESNSGTFGIGRSGNEVGIIYATEIRVGQAASTIGQLIPAQDNQIELGATGARWSQVSSYNGFFQSVIYVGPNSTANGPGIGIFPQAYKGAYAGNASLPFERIYAGNVFHQGLFTFRDEDDVALVQAAHRYDSPTEPWLLDTARMPGQLLDETGEYINQAALFGLLVGAVAQLGARVKELEASR